MLDHEKYMEMCLGLARRAEGRTSPNPIVGSVVVGDDGTILGRGYHQRAGQPHAEVEALAEAGESAWGQTLYVNLEPCCHDGRTPPCANHIIERGLKRVVIGMQDPNVKVAGGGIQQLQDAGIEVIKGVLEEECQWINRGFVKWIQTKMPWVCLKMAVTFDGKIADRNGSSRWISGPEARLYVHDLRNRFDAILIGGRTVVKDDPELTVREIDGSRNPLRIVLDPGLTVSPSARVCKLGEQDNKTVLITTKGAASRKGSTYPPSVEVVSLSESRKELSLKEILAWIGNRGVLTVLCEGGGRLAGALLSEQLVDEVQWIVAPKLIGDAKAVSSADAGKEIPLSEATVLENRSVSMLGSDVLVTAIPLYSDR